MSHPLFEASTKTKVEREFDGIADVNCEEYGYATYYDIVGEHGTDKEVKVSVNGTVEVRDYGLEDWHYYGEITKEGIE